MPTVRLRDASEYPDPAQRLFELSKIWFNHDFKEPAAMSRVMAWDPEFGGGGRGPGDNGPLLKTFIAGLNISF